MCGQEDVGVSNGVSNGVSVCECEGVSAEFISKCLAATLSVSQFKSRMTRPGWGMAGESALLPFFKHLSGS